ncbi:MAG: hypothetical protein JSU72_09770 [Deltaproteobacteria bacterium]|nr:MAG: hypothetical protein JSU72_09770 [Deltaproteobacteria bacterium]
MYLTSFIHRDDLFDVAERWLCGRLEPDDGLRITKILICDGFVLGQALEMVANLLLELIYGDRFRQQRIQFKGRLRDAISSSAQDGDARTKELVNLYQTNPEFFYREAPIHGAICLDQYKRLLGLYRIKRPRRIAEKANRYVANWIFTQVLDRAKEMAQERAKQSDIPLEELVTPRKQMDIEFVAAERDIAQKFKDNTIKLDRAALTIHDVGGIKLIANGERLYRLEERLAEHPKIRIFDRESFSGNYQAVSLIIEVSWDGDQVCRSYMERRTWEQHLRRGIPEAELKKGMAPLLDGAKPTLNLELILSTFPDFVESELGNSLHEERILAQRDNKIYKGYIPMNVEFLIEYLFAVGVSPQVHIDRLPIKLWGRYLPDTVIDHIRSLYRMPESEFYC